MKNIVFVSTELGTGGAEKALTEIAIRLPERGFLPTIVSLRPRPKAGRDLLVTRLEQANLAVRFLEITRPSQFFSAVTALRRIYDDKNAELMLSFLHHANLVAAFAAARRPRLRHFSGVRVAEPRRWRNRVEAWALARCEGIVCVSEEVKRNFAAYFRDEKRLSVIPNGVAPWLETTPVDLSPIGIGKEDPVILFAGRLHPQKGLDWALPQVAKVMTDRTNLQFVIVGDGPQTEELERLAHRQNCSERIHFLGFQPDLAPFYARAQCLVLPSRWEGMPNVVLEAMAAGIPVLASYSSSAAELFSAEATDQLFVFGAGEDFVEKLSRIIDDRQRSTLLGTENREKSNQFSWDAIAGRYAQAFAAVSSTAWF